MNVTEGLMKKAAIALLGCTGVLLGGLGAISPSSAQLVPDDSLGTERSVVQPGLTTQGVPADLIRGGAQRGNNLFHSFREFSINNGQRVYFTNPADSSVENILTRVTGNNVSRIDGLLGVDGSANLFLLNPNGVVFGPNAELDIRGSFTASTANSILLADGSEFSATPSGSELLVMAVPLGVQFNNAPQEDTFQTNSTITVNGDVATNSDNDLTLIASNIEINGTLAQSGGGSIFLRTPQAPGNSVTVSGGNVNTDVQNGSTLNGGNVNITTHELSINNGRVRANTFGQGNAGRVKIRATGDVKVTGSNARIASNADGMSANSGGITIQANNLYVQDGARVNAEVFGSGNAGQIRITATDSIFVQTDARVTSQVRSGGTGNSGGIKIKTTNLQLKSSGRLSANTFANGDAGLIDVEASGDILVDGANFTGIFSQVTGDAVGDSSGININTNNLSVLNSATISTTTFTSNTLNNQPDNPKPPTGNAGSLRVNASGNILVGYGSGIFSRTTDIGTAGNIHLSAEALVMRDGSLISAEANSNGQNGGSVFINTDFLVSGLDENNDIIATATDGNGGEIRINAVNVLGFEEPDRFVPGSFDGLRGDNINDISARSEDGVDGEVVINTLDLDPSRGITELPIDLTDRANQIAVGCGLGEVEDGPGGLVLTGRGGLPISPQDLASPDGLSFPWFTHDNMSHDNNSPGTTVRVQDDSPTALLVEAQHAVTDDSGKTYLISREATSAAAQTEIRKACNSANSS